jgi:hypothetical protein
MANFIGELILGLMLIGATIIVVAGMATLVYMFLAALWEMIRD